MNKSHVCLVALISFLVLANFASIPNVNSVNVIGSNVVSLYPVADSYVNESSISTNYGGDNSLRIECDGYHIYSYIRFDLSSVPSDASIIEAVLWLTIASADGYGYLGTTVGIHYCSNNSWSETEIAWNNKPAFDSEPTTSARFLFLTLPATRGWHITDDVQNALGLDKLLTEVITFEEPDTEWGQMTFKSREAAGVELEIEYTTENICSVEFQSNQDTGNTSNVGNVNFSSTVFPLPNSALVAAGNYEAEYTGGYTFLRWETEGGINALNPNSEQTSVEVTGSGRLRAVGSAEVIRYFYDNTYGGGYTYESAGKMVAVRFTPLFLGTLKKAQFYIARFSSAATTLRVHVMDENFNDLITPFSQAVSSTGWFEVDLSANGISVLHDFYIGVEWLSNYYPGIGEGGGSDYGRNFDWNGTAWNLSQDYTYYTIRAVVESEIPFRQVGIITCIPENDYVSGGNVVVSGAITPARVNTEVTITYIRPDSSTLTRKTYTDSSGGYTNAFTPDKIGLWGVMASWVGDTEYESSQSYPKEVNVNNGSLSLYLSSFYPNTKTIGSSFNLTGSTFPERLATVDLQYSRDSGATWTTFASVNTTQTGDYSYQWTPTSIGNYRVRASWEGDEISGSDTSLEITVIVEQEVIPEFPNWVLPIFMLLITAFAVVMQRIRQKRE